MGLFDQGNSSKGLSPAAMALIGLLAVKGYQNRDKLAGFVNEALGKAGSPNAAPDGSSGGGLGGLLGGLAGMIGGNDTAGHVVSGGLGDILNSFQQAGHGDVAQSWVKEGADRQPAPQQVEQAVGPDFIDRLAQQTGMSREALLQKLAQELPKAVDQLTPDSRLPTPQEVNAAAGGTA